MLKRNQPALPCHYKNCKSVCGLLLSFLSLLWTVALILVNLWTIALILNLSLDNCCHTECQWTIALILNLSVVCVCVCTALSLSGWTIALILSLSVNYCSHFESVWSTAFILSVCGLLLLFGVCL